MNYDFLLFDADNTLLDYDGAEKFALKSVFEQFSIEFNDNFLTEYQRINLAYWKKYEKGEITKANLQTARFKDLLKLLNFNNDPFEFNHFYIKNLGLCSKIMNGADEICQYFFSQKCGIYIVTNGITQTQHNRLNNSVLSKYIIKTFVSEETGFQKPQKQFFDYVFNHIKNFKKDKTIIIGDSLTSDIQGGINAGIATCWYNPKHEKNNYEAIKPDFIINSFEELKDIVL